MDDVLREVQGWASMQFRDTDPAECRVAQKFARALIDAHERIKELEAKQSWQPIATAPKDGTPILGCVRGSVVYVCWYRDRSEDRSRWVFWESGNRDGRLPTCMSFMPTHWMPLPEPPK